MGSWVWLFRQPVEYLAKTPDGVVGVGEDGVEKPTDLSCYLTWPATADEPDNHHDEEGDDRA